MIIIFLPIFKWPWQLWIIADSFCATEFEVSPFSHSRPAANNFNNAVC